MILEIARTFFQIAFSLFSLFAFFYFISVFLGAPYVPTPMDKVKQILKMAKISKKDKVIDLGSGDGRLIIESAKLGAVGLGIEINPGLLIYSIVNAKIKKVSQKAKFSWGSIYNRDLALYNVIFIAGFVNMVGRLEKEFDSKIKKGTKIILYAFPFPNRKASLSANGIYIYQY